MSDVFYFDMIGDFFVTLATNIAKLLCLGKKKEAFSFVLLSTFRNFADK